MKTSVRKMSLAILAAAVVAGFSVIDGYVSAAVACNYYASPNGGGNGSSQSSPFRISNFWSVAGPGKTLCLLDGVYTDSITPPQNLNGTASARITIRALNDGKVRINGGGVRQPVRLENNDFFILEGFDAHNSGSTVVQLHNGADNNIVRRVCAWDAPVGDNVTTMSAHGNTGNLFEDVCGFGTARKIFTNSQGGDNATFRRAWGRWESSTRTDPKQVFSIAYNSYFGTCENCIGTWNETGSPTNRIGILGMDGTTTTNFELNAAYYGSIAYIRAADVLPSIDGIVRTNNDSCNIRYQDVVVYVEGHTNLKPFNLKNDPNCGSTSNKIATRITQIGGDASSTSSQWTVTNNREVSTLGSTDIWDGANQANVCKRYVNGVLTSTPLWPWPMNQRIIDAMKAAGKTPVDVTKTMEEIFGTIPAECRSDSAPAVVVVPVPPANLAVR